MGEKIQIGKIRDAIKHNKKLGGPEGVVKREKEWETYDSPLSDDNDSFASTFIWSLPKEYTKGVVSEALFKKYIEETIEKGGTAVEFGGPGSKLFSGFSEGFFRETAGVCLKDIRSDKQKKVDAENHHYVVSGNVVDVMDAQYAQLFERLAEVLHTRKVDLVISRIGRPLDAFEFNRVILERIIRNWYNLLKEGGLMFIQVTRQDKTDLSQIQYIRGAINEIAEIWVNAIKKEVPEIDAEMNHGLLRLHKLPNAPEELPRMRKLFS